MYNYNKLLVGTTRYSDITNPKIYNYNKLLVGTTRNCDIKTTTKDW